jgi:hypothetical protein
MSYRRSLADLIVKRGTREASSYIKSKGFSKEAS